MMYKLSCLVRFWPGISNYLSYNNNDNYMFPVRRPGVHLDHLKRTRHTCHMRPTNAGENNNRHRALIQTEMSGFGVPSQVWSPNTTITSLLPLVFLLPSHSLVISGTCKRLLRDPRNHLPRAVHNPRALTTLGVRNY
jgi:hypothetical protein